MQHKRALNELIGEVPNGFTLQANGKTLTPDPAEQAVLSIIMKLRCAGLSSRAIAAELNRLNVPTKKGQGQWSFSVIRRIVHQYYSGLYSNRRQAPGAPSAVFPRRNGEAVRIDAAKTDDFNDKIKILYALISAQPTDQREMIFKALPLRPMRTPKLHLQRIL